MQSFTSGILQQKTKIMASGPIISWQINGETIETVADFISLGSKIMVDSDCSHGIKRCLLFGRKVMTNLDRLLKSREILCWQGLYSQRYGFLSSNAQMWELGYREGWALKNWCFWTMDSKEIKPVNPKGSQLWILIGRTDAEAETPILWPPDVKNWLLGKTLMLGKIEGRRRRG